MGAVKGVGMNAVETIVANRKDGKYKSIFDLAKRIDLRAANKKAIENLALAGGFDCFTDTYRAQYFHTDGDNITFYEKAIRYGAKFQENENSSQVSLFGDASDVQIAEPTVPPCEDWSTMEKLAKEKEVVGIYISGHPLDDYIFEMKYFCNSKLENLKNLGSHIGKNLTFAGIVTNVQYKTAKNGKDWAMFTLEGYDESHEFRIFDEEYLKFRHFLVNNQFVYFKVTVKDGWVNRETGKKSEPRLQFLDVKQLQDVLTQFAKKLSIHMDINDLHQNFIQQLNQLFITNKGDNTVTFEIIEQEKVQKLIEIVPKIIAEEEATFDIENPEEIAVDIPIEEENQVVTRVSMPSRKLKIKISNELLVALEKMNIKFSLN
jgi:DNA polymerase-3 subunit alpha